MNFIGIEMFSQVVTLLMKNSNLLTQILEQIPGEPINIRCKVFDGELFWETLAKCNGWKLQQNQFTRHARILNSERVRIAWGSLEGMEKALDEMIRISNKYK